MKACEIAEKLDFKLVAGKEGVDNEIEGLYTCDLLSWVMGKIDEKTMWFSVMGNINAVAVASLMEVSAIVITENAPVDEDAITRADMMGIPIYTTSLSSAKALILVNDLIR